MAESVFQMELSEDPRIWGFVDYREFLRSYYEWHRRYGNLSHAIFSKRAGLKSRSYLRLVLTGKRNLSPDGIQKFTKGLQLTPYEAEAFTALVNYNQSSDPRARDYYWDMFLKLKPKAQDTADLNGENLILSKMVFPVLMVLLRQSHIKSDVHSLADVIGKSPEKIQEAIEQLIELGMVERSAEGGYTVSVNSYKTMSDYPNSAI